MGILNLQGYLRNMTTIDININMHMHKIKYISVQNVHFWILIGDKLHLTKKFNIKIKPNEFLIAIEV